MKSKLDQTYMKAIDSLVTQLEELEATPMLTSEVLEVIQHEVASAFCAGWEARDQLVEVSDSNELDPPIPPLRTVRSLAEVGDRGWVQPFAVIETLSDGYIYIDPRFPVAVECSEQCCMEVSMTEEGLAARGPANRHRLIPELDPHRFLELVEFREYGTADGGER